MGMISLRTLALKFMGLLMAILALLLMSILGLEHSKLNNFKKRNKIANDFIGQ
jgi:hypothetical protein